MINAPLVAGLAMPVLIVGVVGMNPDLRGACRMPLPRAPDPTVQIGKDRRG